MATVAKRTHADILPETPLAPDPVCVTMPPDTFNYVTLEISADGKSLAVDTWGIDSYLPNSFPEPSQVATPRRILGFRVEAE